MKKVLEGLICPANVVSSEPHAAFAAFTHSIVNKITFLSRTTPSFDPLLQPLDNVTQSNFIPAWTGQTPPNHINPEFFALCTCLSRLGVIFPSFQELSASVKNFSQLYQLTEAQQTKCSWEAMYDKMRAKQDVCNRGVGSRMDR